MYVSVCMEEGMKSLTKNKYRKIRWRLYNIYKIIRLWPLEKGRKEVFELIT